MRPSRMKFGRISEFDSTVICSYDAASTENPLIFTRQMSDCGRNRLRDLVGPDLPRVDANTIQFPSGENTGSKLCTPETDGVSRAQLLPWASTIHRPRVSPDD